METLAIYNEENISEDELINLRHRLAVRGVILDNENNVALLYSQYNNYYSIPGGGVDGKENLKDAIIRECKEEIGCDIEIISELGKTLEYKKEDNLINESFGFFGKIISTKGNPIWVGDENEDEKSSVVIWVPIQKAIDLLMSSHQSENLYNRYHMSRNLTFLKKAQELI